MKAIKLLIVPVVVLAVILSSSVFAKGKKHKKDDSEKYLRWWDHTYKGADSAVLGEIFYQKGDYKNAIGKLEDAIQAGTNDGRVYYQLAFSYQETGNIDRAIELYKKSVHLLDKEKPAHRYCYYARYNLALLYKDKGNIDNAKAVLKKALQMRKDPSGYNLLGWLDWKQAKIKDALKDYKNSIKIDENQENAQYNLAVLYYNKGSKNEAEKAFKKAVSLNPGNKKASAYITALEGGTALNKSEYANILMPEPFLRHCYLGKKAMDNGDIASAKSEYETAFEIKPDSPIVNQGLGVVYEYNKKGLRYGNGFNIEKSIFHYKKAVSVNPNLKQALFNLAVLYDKQDRTDKSIWTYLKLISIPVSLQEQGKSIPTDMYSANAHYNLAVIYDRKKKDYQKAMYHYAKYLKLNPETSKKKQIKAHMRRLICN